MVHADKILQRKLQIQGVAETVNTTTIFKAHNEGNSNKHSGQEKPVFTQYYLTSELNKVK
jgi:hypothetical protein